MPIDSRSRSGVSVQATKNSRATAELTYIKNPLYSAYRVVLVDTVTSDSLASLSSSMGVVRVFPSGVEDLDKKFCISVLTASIVYTGI